jgi:hypothetical protein
MDFWLVLDDQVSFPPTRMSSTHAASARIGDFFIATRCGNGFFSPICTLLEDRYELVRKDGLQGFCSWVLGQKDTGI